MQEEKLDLPFSVENLRKVLAAGADKDSPLTHEQLADWCLRFWWECKEGSLSGVEDESLDVAAKVALDVDAQWDLYLSNEYTLSELRAIDLSKVRLPQEWFNSWQKKLDAHNP